MKTKLLSCLMLVGGVVFTSCQKEEAEKAPSIDKAPNLEKAPELPPETPEEISSELVLSSVELLSSSQIEVNPNEGEDTHPDKSDTLKLNISKSPIDDMPVGELWALYKSSRSIGKALEDTSEFHKAADAFVKAAEVVVKLERPSIASWQYNSAAKNLIDAFSKDCKYYSSVEKLNSMKSGKEKTEFRQELKECFAKHSELLEKAWAYLDKAEEMDLEEPEKGRDDIIKRNKQFVTFVKKFIR